MPTRQWTSTDEIVQVLNLESDPNDTNAIKRELRLLLSKAHPDRNGGEFLDPEDRAEYNSILAAYESVADMSSNAQALVPITQLPAIIKAVREAQTVPVVETQVNTFKTECRAEIRTMSHDRHFLPRIGSGTFAGVCAFLFTFSASLEEHPMLGTIAKNQYYHMLLLMCTVYAAFFFVMTWIRERREEAKTEWLMSERGRREIFTYVFGEASRNSDGRFALSDVIKILMQKSGLQPHSILAMTLLSPGQISIAVAEKIATVHLMELESRGVIYKIEGPSIEAIYRVDDAMRSSYPSTTADFSLPESPS